MRIIGVALIVLAVVLVTLALTRVIDPRLATAISTFLVLVMIGPLQRRRRRLDFEARARLAEADQQADAARRASARP